MKTGIIIQARMGSTRLPGKVLMPLPANSRLTTLDWVIGSCRETGYPVFVATSLRLEDDAIEKHVIDTWTHIEDPVTIARGSAGDVLDRLFQCAKFHDLDEIVRITGDCPFIDPEVILQVIALRRETGADYASNVDPATWPDGLDVQVVTIAALADAHRYATDPSDRDTVLQWIVRRRKDYSVVNLPCPIRGLERRRWVLDTQEDYKICCRVAEALLAQGKFHPRLVDLLAATGPEEAPAGSRNERYLSARAPELKVEDTSGSDGALDRALQFQPYGASTYSKSHVAWGKEMPLFLTHAQGSRVFDVDGNELIDFTGALGTTILGHNDPGIRDAITRQLDSGIAFPLAHDIEKDVASMLLDRMPFPHGMVVFGKNGSDVTSAAVRVAKVFTGRKIILMQHDGYHGWHDWALSGTPRLNGETASPVLRVRKEDMLPPGLINHCAAMIVEPDRIPVDDLQAAVEKCRDAGVLVIFDEMVTAFRYRQRTYAETFGFTPDLICLGKGLGNGMPITALAGHHSIMSKFVAEKDSDPYAFYSGTHFGETLSLAAAAHVLQRMDLIHCGELARIAAAIHGIVWRAVDRAGLNGVVEVGPAPLTRLTFPDAGWANTFRRTMAAHGCLVYSAFFAMLAHTSDDLFQLERALDAAMAALIRHEAHPMPAAAGIMRS